MSEKITKKYICNDEFHGDNPRIWESKQSGNLSQIKCTTRGGAKGCGKTGQVQSYTPTIKAKKVATGSDFSNRYDKIMKDRNREEKKVQKEVTKSKKVKTNLTFLISDNMIRSFHHAIVKLIEEFIKEDINITPEIEDELLIKAREVVNLLTMESTPLNSYIMIWVMLLAPVIMKKGFKLLFGQKKDNKKEVIKDDKIEEEISENS